MTRREPGTVAVGAEPAGTLRAPAAAGAVWALLIVNTLGSGGTGTIIPIPTRVAQLITMGSLAVAFLLALVLNPRVRIRPNTYLFLLSLLLVVSLAASLRLESGLGALARCARLAVFLAVLWLLSPYFEDAFAFVRYHIRALVVILLSVLIGLALAPGLALPDSYGNRLVGTLWYLTPPRVAQYAAIAAGLAVLLWIGRLVTGPVVAWIVGGTAAVLVLAHTRTAIAALGAGLVVAGACLAPISTRARRVLAGVSVVVLAAVVFFGSALLEWLRRGQSAEELRNLTGRMEVWNRILALDRSIVDQLFGIGLTNKSFDGHPIDSTWFAVYYEQGLVGVAIVAAVFLWLIVLAVRRPNTPRRACAVFLIVYCLVASYPEVGIGDASPYVLHLALASALLTPTASSGARMTHEFPGGSG